MFQDSKQFGKLILLALPEIRNLSKIYPESEIQDGIQKSEIIVASGMPSIWYARPHAHTDTHIILLDAQ